jgi:hypothetical protein
VSDVYAIVRDIRAQRFSRNRHFEAHTSPASIAARRLHRFLKGIERDLQAATSIEVRSSNGRVVVSMAFNPVRMTRVVSLTSEEHALLVEDPRIAELLQTRSG